MFLVGWIAGWYWKDLESTIHSLESSVQKPGSPCAGCWVENDALKMVKT